jgi:hypothetical protein
VDRFKAFFLKLTYRERVLTFSAILAAFAATLQFLVLEEIRKVHILHTQIQTVDQEIAQKQRMIESFREAKGTDVRDSPLWPYHAANLGLSNFVRTVSSLDQGADGLRVRRIVSEKVDRQPDFDKTTLQIEVEAPFNRIGAFLEDLENSRLMTRVELVEVFRIDKELQTCRAKIVLDSYSWRDE